MTTRTILHSNLNTDANITDGDNNNQPHKIAVAQLCSTKSKYDNLMNIAKCAGYAAKNHCRMLFLPECFGFMGENSQQTLQYAEKPSHLLKGDDTTPPQIDTAIQQKLEAMVLRYQTETYNNLQEYQDQTVDDIDLDNNNNISLLAGLIKISKASNIWISAGGMHVGGAPPALPSTNANDNDSSRVYNTHVIIDQYGNVVSYYRKIHLFDVMIPNQVNLQESKTTAPGSKIVVCDSPIGRLGLSVCYDLRFPETYIELVKQGAEILLVPSAFTVPTGKAHWHTLLKARAIENQCFVIAAAQFGKHNEKRDSYGHSIVIDPWGEIVADAGGYDGPGTSTTIDNIDFKIHHDDGILLTPSVTICDIDLNYIQTIRQRMPIQAHRARAFI